MGTQTMGSQGGGGGGGVNDTTTPKPTTICRQGSLYNLTLDEVQGSLGKPLTSMNMDELLKTVWTVESNQSLPIETAPNETPSGSNLNRQSSISLSREMSKKTVDEVWKEIVLGKRSIAQEWDPQRQNTLGEMTLEDFLAHAGVALDESGAHGTGDGQGGWVGVEPDVSQWVQYQQQQQNMMSMLIPGQNVVDTVALGVSGSPVVGTVCEPGGGGSGRKRGPPGVVVVEKTVERRQKRMIKNRESAARSRARKQAYTNELENKVSELEAENQRLRKMREVEKALPSVPPPEQPKYQLRRTSSSPF